MSGQLIEDPAVQDALATYLVNQLYANVDVAAELEQNLPEQAAPLAGPLAAGLREVSLRAARALLARPATIELFKNANRVAHTELIAVLDGDTQRLSTTNGEVVLDLRPILERLGQSALGAKLLSNLPPDAGPNRDPQVGSAEERPAGDQGLARAVDCAHAPCGRAVRRCRVALALPPQDALLGWFLGRALGRARAARQARRWHLPRRRAHEERARLEGGRPGGLDNHDHASSQRRHHPRRLRRCGHGRCAARRADTSRNDDPTLAGTNPRDATGGGVRRRPSSRSCSYSLSARRTGSGSSRSRCSPASH